MRLAWLGRIYSPGRIPWKAFLDYLLENYGGTFFVSCNYNMRDYNINSSFYRELLQWWDDFRNAFSSLPLTAKNMIWNNKLINIEGKSIYYHDYVKAGILLTNQMQFDKARYLYFLQSGNRNHLSLILRIFFYYSLLGKLWKLLVCTFRQKGKIYVTRCIYR